MYRESFGSYFSMTNTKANQAAWSTGPLGLLLDVARMREDFAARGTAVALPQYGQHPRTPGAVQGLLGALGRRGQVGGGGGWGGAQRGPEVGAGAADAAS